MGSVKDIYKGAPFLKGFLSAFDLFGVLSLSKEDIKKSFILKSKIKINENDLDLLIQDMQKAITQYDKEIFQLQQR